MSTTIEIEGKNYEVHDLDEPRRLRYKFVTGAIRRKLAWKALYDSVKDLPQHLQEIVFAKGITPSRSVRATQEVYTSREAVEVLCSLCIRGDCPEVTEANCVEIFMDIFPKIQDSIWDSDDEKVEKRYTGQDAIDFLQKKKNKEGGGE